MADGKRIVIGAWSAAVVFVLSMPFVVWGTWRAQWTELPVSRALERGCPFQKASLDGALVAAGRELKFETAGLLVECEPGEHFTHPRVGAGRTLLSGYMVSAKHVMVAVPDGETIGGTALFHELTHVAKARRGEGLTDTDHQSWTDADWALEKALKTRFQRSP